MFMKFIAFLALVAAFASPAAAARTATFANYDNWRIYASFDDDNQFSFCAAASTYKSGTHFSIIYYRKRAEWVLQFYHDGWPERTGNTPVTLQVDGNNVTRGNARFFKRSVFVDLGPSIDRVTALMRGRELSVITGAGTSKFSLKGSSGATVRVARCLQAHMKTNPATTQGAVAGAFAPVPQANQGAFAPAPLANRPRQQPAPRSQKLSRAETLEFAVNYLNQNKVSYKLLPAEGSYFKNFPVNWSYGPKSYGAMMILRNSGKSSSDQLGTLLGDQARLCTDKSATSRGPADKTAKSVIHRATGACSSNGQNYALHYTVIEDTTTPTQILIVEMISAGDAGAKPGIGGDKPDSEKTGSDKQWRIEGVETPDQP